MNLKYPEDLYFILGLLVPGLITINSEFISLVLKIAEQQLASFQTARYGS